MWHPDETKSALGADAEWFNEVFGVTTQGNFEHDKSVLHLTKSPEALQEQYNLSESDFWSKVGKNAEKLLKERAKRVRPGRDEKVLTSWNCLMITAFIDGYRVLKEPKYLEAARRATTFIFNNLIKDGRLLRTWGQGKAKLNGYLDDYSYFVQTLLDLAEVDTNPKWLQEAERLTKLMLEQFSDTESGGLFYTSSDHEELVTRPKSHYDGSIPSGSSVAVFGLLRLAKLTGNKEYEKKAVDLLKMYTPFMTRVPDQFSNFLCAIDFYLARETEVACIFKTDGTQQTLRQCYSKCSHTIFQIKWCCAATNPIVPLCPYWKEERQSKASRQLMSARTTHATRPSPTSKCSGHGCALWPEGPPKGWRTLRVLESS